MLPWKKLTLDAQALGIDQHKSEALVWIRRHLPELSIWYRKDNGETGFSNDRFDWDGEWLKWQQNFDALHWLVRARSLPPGPRRPAHRIPHWVQLVVDNYLSQTRNVILSDWITEARICLQLSGTYTAGGTFQTLDEFWQAVFVSFFEPEDLSLGYCKDCGKRLAPTTKLGKASRAQLCSACRVKKWRREHPDEAREMWRLAKAGGSTARNIKTGKLRSASSRKK